MKSDGTFFGLGAGGPEQKGDREGSRGVPASLLFGGTFHDHLHVQTQCAMSSVFCLYLPAQWAAHLDKDVSKYIYVEQKMGQLQGQIYSQSIYYVRS